MIPIPKQITSPEFKSKYTLRLHGRPSTVSETDENGSTTPSVEKIVVHKVIRQVQAPNSPLLSQSSETSTETTEMSSDPSNPSASQTVSSTTTTSRMENGEKFPRLATGTFNKKVPLPILVDHQLHSASYQKEVGTLPHPSVCEGEKEKMEEASGGLWGRGPPPAWQPPRPPTEHDYENNYEDPEDMKHQHKNENSHDSDLLIASVPPPTYNSYEMSLSQQRRSREPVAPPLEDWDENSTQRVLHKNAQGTYYIPASTASVRTTTSTLSPTQNRYRDQCGSMLASGSVPRGISRPGDPSNASLLKFQTTATIQTATQPHKRRPSKLTVSEEKRDLMGEGELLGAKRPGFCLLFLGACLALALIVILILILRSPSYVYTERLPGAEDAATLEMAGLRALPPTIHLGQTVEADVMAQSVANTAVDINTSGRVQLQVSMERGAQLVLLLRRFAPPSFYSYDYYRPLVQHNVAEKDHQVSESRFRRAVEDSDRFVVLIEEYLVQARYHIAIVNDRKRNETIRLLVTQKGKDKSKLSLLSCYDDCHDRGDCIEGRCHCVAGFTGQSCEEPLCPVVCSGNGVFAGGRCVCHAGYKGKECETPAGRCEVSDCSGHGVCGRDGVCRCDRGWTGSACDMRACQPHPTCSDRGVCVKGQCFCREGWKGRDCATPVMETKWRNPFEETAPTTTKSSQEKLTASNEQRAGREPKRPVPHLTERAQLESSRSGRLPEFQAPRSSMGRVPSSVTSTAATMVCVHGKTDDRRRVCVCEPGWHGVNCEKKDCPSCLNGVCVDGECECFAGWQGRECSLTSCPQGCKDHGRCLPSGVCKCQQGWSGDNCQIVSCRNNCSDYGQCRSDPDMDGESHCVCQHGRQGEDCSVMREHDCTDGLDNDGDGMRDCLDPDCTEHSSCANTMGATLLTPSDVLLKTPSVRNAPFAQRVAFLTFKVNGNSLHNYANMGNFNASVVSVIRGRVVYNAGSLEHPVLLPLAGVRVSDMLHHQVAGFALSRADGFFDVLANAGQSLKLRFMTTGRNLDKVDKYVYPLPNEIFDVGDIVITRDNMVLQRPPRVQCEPVKRMIVSPLVLPVWSFGTDGLDRTAVVVDSRSIVQRIPIAGTSMSLVYDSTRSRAARSSLVIGLLDSTPDPQLRLVHVHVTAAGTRYSTRLAPRVNLTHVWSWDRRNVYTQSEQGLVNVDVNIGYEYVNCSLANEIVWVKRRVQVEGAPARSMEAGGWTVDIHHHLDTINNVVELGNGGRRFLTEEGHTVVTAVGTGTRRQFDCSNCDGLANTAELYRPSCLALDQNGSLYIGDGNLIRRLQPDGTVKTVLVLRQHDATSSYHLAVNPVNNQLYISLPLSKQIWMVKNLEASNDLENNYMVYAGTGSSCLNSVDVCGDGGAALDADLEHPRGMDFDRRGNLYLADGRRIRVIEADNNDIAGAIRSLGEYDSSRPPQCSGSQMPLDSLQLFWPTAVAVDRTLDVVYVLDMQKNVVYQLDETRKAYRVVIGNPSSCTNSTLDILRYPQSIAVGPDGALYATESDKKTINQITRFVVSGGAATRFAGVVGHCSCEENSCPCDDRPRSTEDNMGRAPLAAVRFNYPQGLVVSPKGVVYVADTNNHKVKRIATNTAQFNSHTRLYTVVEADKNELYAFNRHGLHVWTQSLTTRRVLYNFTYTVDSSLGLLSSIHGAGGMLEVSVKRNGSHVVLETSTGRKTLMTLGKYDTRVASIQPQGHDTVELQYSPGGLVTSVKEGGQATAFEWDKNGRLRLVSRDGESFLFDDDKIISGRYITSVYRNGQFFSEFSANGREIKYSDSTWTRQIDLENGVLVVSSSGVKTLVDAQEHPVFKEPTLLKMRTTIKSSESTGDRRDMVSKFEWNAYMKRGEERRVAEVGNRPKINDQNLYTVAYDRRMNRDVFRNKPDEVILVVDYTDNGDVTMIRPSLEDQTDGVASLRILHHTLGRRSEMQWGNRSVKWSFDHKNRLVESSDVLGRKVRSQYPRDGLLPTTMETPSGKFNMKYSSIGGLQQVTSPSGETNTFSATPTGNGRLIRRRLPWTKRWQSRAEDSRGRLLEWVTGDEAHHVLIERDSYGRPLKESNDGSMTTFSYDSASRLVRVTSSESEVDISWQGPVMIACTEKRIRNNRTNSFHWDYDALFRPTAVQAVVANTALESLQMSYDDRTGLMNSIGNFKVLRSRSLIRILDGTLTSEWELDSYGKWTVARVQMGAVRVVQTVWRDGAGRVSSVLWETPDGEVKEVKAVDALGRPVTWSRNGEREAVEYDIEGRIASVNDSKVEWLAGGVPKKIADVTYSAENGWIVKRGDIAFEYDGFGRIVAAKKESVGYGFNYDHKGRLVYVKIGDMEYSLFYGLPQHPTRVSHFVAGAAGAVSMILYTEDGQPFALVRDGVRYALVLDDEHSLRFILSDSQVTKEVVRGVFGRVRRDSNTAMWIPIGYLGGVEIADLSLVIYEGRPLDCISGRFMSYGPSQLDDVTLEDLPTSIDIFSGPLSRPVPPFPTDIASWFRLVGLSPCLLPAVSQRLPMTGASQPLVTRGIAAFPSRLAVMQNAQSVSPSLLMEGVERKETEKLKESRLRFYQEEYGFPQMFVMAPKDNKSMVVKSLGKLNKQELANVTLLLESSRDIGWRSWQSGLELHLARSGPVPAGLVSAAYTDMVLVVQRDVVEMKAGKWKIVVHFTHDESKVVGALVEELRRQQLQTVWRTEKLRVERRLGARGRWSDKQKRELLSKGVVTGYTTAFNNLGDCRFPNVHQWTFQRIR